MSIVCEVASEGQSLDLAIPTGLSNTATFCLTIVAEMQAAQVGGRTRDQGEISPKQVDEHSM